MHVRFQGLSPRISDHEAFQRQGERTQNLARRQAPSAFSGRRVPPIHARVQLEGLEARQRGQAGKQARHRASQIHVHATGGAGVAWDAVVVALALQRRAVVVDVDGCARPASCKRQQRGRQGGQRAHGDKKGLAAWPLLQSGRSDLALTRKRDRSGGRKAASSRAPL